MNLTALIATLRLKEQVGPRIGEPFEAHLFDRLRTRRVPRLDAMLSLGRDLRRGRGDAILLTAFGRYRAPFSLIERLASDLAPLALEHDVLPLIRPMKAEDLAGMTSEAPFLKQAFERGRLLYWRQSRL